MFRETESTDNPFLDSLHLLDLPALAGQTGPEVIVNLGLLNGLNDGYYSYVGSLSRPPCTEGVKRFVLRTYQDVSTAQLKYFRDIFFNNNRPIQSRNDRGIIVHGVRLHSEIMEKVM